MTERNITPLGILAMWSDAFDPIYMRWLIMAAIVIILVDLRFGVRKAKYKGEEVRFSRACRRTMNKFIDYLCWMAVGVTLGGSFGGAFAVPLIPVTVMLFVMGIEINSAANNYLESKGKKLRINIFKLFKKKTNLSDITESDEK